MKINKTYYSATLRNKKLTQATTQMKLQNMMPRERNPTQEAA